MLKKILSFGVGTVIVLGILGCQTDPGTITTPMELPETDGGWNVEGIVWDDGDPVFNCRVDIQVYFIGVPPDPPDPNWRTVKTVYTDDQGCYVALNCWQSRDPARVRFYKYGLGERYSAEWEAYPDTTYSVAMDFAWPAIDD